MSKVLILVEGPTEERFVKDVLYADFVSRGVVLEPIVVTTKRIKSGGKFTGGISNYAKIKMDIRNLLGDSAAAAVTTMLDFYGLPNDFPGHSTIPRGSCYDKVSHLECALADDIGNSRLIPYLSLHEFEAMLFSVPKAVSTVLIENTVEASISGIVAGFANPEHINLTHPPSKRLLELVPAYRKPLHGPQVVLEGGLSVIRAACPHLNEWIARLEQIVA